MKKTAEQRTDARDNNERLRNIVKKNKVAYRNYKLNEKKLKKDRVSPSSYETKIKNPENLLEIDNLQTYFYTDAGTVKAVDGVTINVPAGKTVGIVGESGCGKSVTSLSVMRLLQGPTGQIVGGEMRFRSEHGDVNLVNLPESKMRDIRGKEIAMIFQEPMTSLNPVFTIGKQLDESISLHMPEKTRAEVKALSIKMLETVGIARAEGIYAAYPHELSGGMRQRVMIAMALSCQPKLIIADEPTTALDVTIQAQILDLMRKIKNQISASIMLITHDLGVIAEMADYVIVMYAGRIIEEGTVKEIFANPMHPYTIGLLESKPVLGKLSEELYSIPGQVPNPISMPDYCYFKSRCEKSCGECEGKYPHMFDVTDTHKVACWLYSSNEKGADVNVSK